MSKNKKQLPPARANKLSPFGKFKMGSDEPKMKSGKPNGYKKPGGFSGFGK